MTDAVCIEVDKWSVSGKHRVSASGAHEDPSHIQHPPGAIEDFRYRSFTVDDARVELVQHVTHLAHPLDEASMRNEIAVEALNGGARQGHRCHRNELRDL